MKLGWKISLLFGCTFLVALMIVGAINVKVNIDTAESRVFQGMETASKLAGKQLSEQLKTYEDMIGVTGTDGILTTENDGSKLAERMDGLAAAYGFTSGNVLDSKGVSFKDGTDFGDREYVQLALNRTVNISDITLSKLTGKYGFSVAGPLNDKSGNVKGVVYFRMDVDFMDAILSRIQVSDNGYAFLVNGDGLVIVHPDETLIGQMNINEGNKELASMMSLVAAGNSGRGEYNYNGNDMAAYYMPVEGTNGWSLFVVVPKADYMDEILRTVNKLILLDIAVWAVVMVLAAVFAGSITATARRVVELMNKLAQGDFSDDLKPSTKKDEIAMIQNSVCSLRDTFTSIVSEENRVLGAITRYDMTEPDITGYQGEFKVLTDSVNNIKSMLTQMIMEIQSMGLQISAGTQEIADATNQLSLGATRQADAVDQVVNNVEDIADNIMQSKENQNVVQEKLRELETLIENGNMEMNRLFDTVKEVEAMSNDIQQIVKMIDSIAFQTNILALNASVEAARAGDAGRGFAVVADEVGNLAEKSGGASKQTAELIESCLRDIRNADAYAKSTFEVLKTIMANSKDINAAFEELSEATRQQAEKSANIKTAVQNIADVVSSNTATSEETAAATVELSSQADTMSKMIRRFKIGSR